MIQTKTLFVLGAGASKPYGFPTGAELREQIWRLGTINAQSALAIAITGLGIEWRAFCGFTEAFRNSRVASIDDFLSRHANYGEMGKIAIAAIIQNHEKPSNAEPQNVDGDWYSALWNALVRDARHAEDLRLNAVRFITFNYDRSLEHVLYNAAASTFPLEKLEAKKAIEAFQIVHMYGQLGRYHYGDESGCVPYIDSKYETAYIKLAAEGIKIIPESRAPDEEATKARQWMDWADQICFLGFGFDRANISRGGIAESLDFHVRSGTRQPTLFASTYHMTKAEIQAARLQMGPHATTMQTFDKECLDTLRETGILVM